MQAAAAAPSVPRWPTFYLSSSALSLFAPLLNSIPARDSKMRTPPAWGMFYKEMCRAVGHCFTANFIDLETELHRNSCECMIPIC